MRLEKRASRASTLGNLGAGREDNSLDGLIEDLLETLLGEGRALHELESLDLLSHVDTLLVGDGSETLLAERL